MKLLFKSLFNTSVYLSQVLFKMFPKNRTVAKEMNTIIVTHGLSFLLIIINQKC